MLRSSIAVPLTALLGLTLSACGGAAYKGTYESCLREPGSYGDGATRTGYVSALKIERDDYYVGGVEREKLFKTSITRKDCKDSLHVSGPGVDLSVGPFRPLWDEGFAASYKTSRLAFAYYEEEHRAFVWIDGKTYGPYDDISVSPRFSENGEHVAYQAHERDGTYTLYVDTVRIPDSPRLSDWPFLYVLDDGKVAAPSYQKDTRIQVIVGDYRGPIVDKLCSNWGFQPGPRGHWGYTADIGGKFFTVIDGERVEAAGVPKSCEIKFSEDGSRSGYISMPTEGDPASKRGLVLDRVLRPELEMATEIAFQGSIAIATTEDKRSPGGPINVLHLVGLPTPGVAPSPDADPAQQGGGSASRIRVKIGDSLGPILTVFEWPSLEVDEAGHVRYRGQLGGEEVSLVDNVIQRLQVPARAETDASGDGSR